MKKYKSYSQSFLSINVSVFFPISTLNFPITILLPYLREVTCEYKTDLSYLFLFKFAISIKTLSLSHTLSLSLSNTHSRTYTLDIYLCLYLNRFLCIFISNVHLLFFVSRVNPIKINPKNSKRQSHKKLLRKLKCQSFIEDWS